VLQRKETLRWSEVLKPNRKIEEKYRVCAGCPPHLAGLAAASLAAGATTLKTEGARARPLGCDRANQIDLAE